MRRQIACLGLAARSSIWRVLAILLAMLAAEAGAFALTLRSNLYMGLEDILDRLPMRLISALALAGIAAAVSLSGPPSAYTADRLPVGRRALAAWWMGYGVVCFAAVWAVRMLGVYGLCRWYAAAEGAPLAPQRVFLAAYVSGTFHSLLPLADASRWAAAVMLQLGLGLTCGAAAAGCRRSAWCAVGPALAALTILPEGGVGSVGWSLFLGVMALAMGLWSAETALVGGEAP